MPVEHITPSSNVVVFPRFRAVRFCCPARIRDRAQAAIVVDDSLAHCGIARGAVLVYCQQEYRCGDTVVVQLINGWRLARLVSARTLDYLVQWVDCGRIESVRASSAVIGGRIVRICYCQYGGGVCTTLSGLRACSGPGNRALQGLGSS